MRIRPAHADDLVSIVEIHNSAILASEIAFTRPHSLEERRPWLTRRPENRPLLVAEDEGRVVGWAELSDYRAGRQALRHTAEIGYFVAASHRRRGVATSLVERCIELAPSLEIRTLLAILLGNNSASIALLEKQGFAPWGRLPGIVDLDGLEVDHLYYGLRVRDGA